MNYADLKAAIAAVIKDNLKQGITGSNLQAQLLSMVDALGAGYQFGGVVTPSDTFDTDTLADVKVAYLASTAGTYTNFGGLTVEAGELAVLLYSGTWSKASVSATVTEGTWAELTALRDAGDLVPGSVYRMTDYVATTTQEDTRSAGHAFDLILFATEAGTFSEECLAVPHSGDTYFAEANLAVWKVWYCLDNDTDRFLWADAENGKGVVYRLIDEWGNDIPYDFKGIQFKRVIVSGDFVEEAYEDADVLYLGIPGSIPSVFDVEDEDDYIWAYTFNGIDDEDDYRQTRDVTVKGFLTGDDEDGGYPLYLRASDVEMQPWRVEAVSDDGAPSSAVMLNNIVFVQMYFNSFNYDVSGNRFGFGCHDITIGSKESYGNTFGNNCYYNTFGNNCYYNTFGNNCYYNTFGNYCTYNTFGNYCTYNTFGNSCYSNTFGNNCYYNTFGNNVQYGTVDQGVTFIAVTTTGTATVKYFYIQSGTAGTSKNRLNINFQKDKTYPQYAGRDSSGDLQIWTPADLV